MSRGVESGAPRSSVDFGGDAKAHAVDLAAGARAGNALRRAELHADALADEIDKFRLHLLLLLALLGFGGRQGVLPQLFEQAGAQGIAIVGQQQPHAQGVDGQAFMLGVAGFIALGKFVDEVLGGLARPGWLGMRVLSRCTAQ